MAFQKRTWPKQTIVDGIETKIWLNKGYSVIYLDDPLKSTRRVHSFCMYNTLTDRLFKSQGGWYILGGDSILHFFSRTLYEVTFRDLYQALKFDYPLTKTTA